MTQHTSTSAPPWSLGQLVLYFLKLGTIGFGGPAALVGYMRRDLVDEGRHIDITSKPAQPAMLPVNLKTGEFD